MELKVDDVVQIGDIPDVNLKFLVGKLGIITQVLNSPARRNRGFMVRVTGLPEDEQEWFIDLNYVSIIK